MLTKTKINEAFKGFFQEVARAKGSRPTRQIAGYTVSGYRLQNFKGAHVPWLARYDVEGTTFGGDRAEVVKYLYTHQKGE